MGAASHSAAKRSAANIPSGSGVGSVTSSAADAPDRGQIEGGERSMIRTLLAAVAAGGILAAGAAQAQDKIKIGVLATLEGALTTLGEDAMRGMEVAMKQAERQGRRQDHRGRHLPDQCEPGFGDPRRAQAGRAGQGRHPDRAGVGLGRHRDPRLLQDPAAGDLPQRLLGRDGDDLCDAVGELLPLQHRRRAVDGWARQLRLQRQEVQEDRDPGGRLLLPLHAAVRLRAGILPGRRADHRAVLGAARHQGFRARSSPSCPTTSTRSISASAAATP